MLRSFAVGIAFALLAAACSSGGSSDTSGVTTGSSSTTPGSSAPDSTTTTTPEDRDPMVPFDAERPPGIDAELVASRESGGGLLANQEVLDLFAAAYGPIPGGDPDRFDPRPADGSLILRNMSRILDELDPEQQAAFRAALGPAPGASAAEDGSVEVLPAIHRPGVTGAGPADLTALANAQSDVISGLLGRPLGLTLEVISGGGLGDFNGDAYPYGGGEPDAIPYDTCRIRMRPQLGGGELLNTITHEVFHCYQFTFTDGWPDASDWVAEGQAAWVGARAGTPDAGTQANQAAWVAGARESLFTKDYDAIGFYWAMEQAGVDIWAAMPAMFDKSDEEAATVMGAPTSVVMWMGTTDGRYEDGALPVEANWRIEAGDAPFFTRRSDWFKVTEDDPFEESKVLKEFSRFGVWQFDLEDELAYLTFTADSGGFEFVEEGGFKSFSGPFNGRFCIREGGCKCESEEKFEQGSDRLIVAVGSVGGGEATVQVEMEELRGFADGAWEGELIATPIVTDTGGAILRGDPIGAPFTLEVSEGKVIGQYSTAMAQFLDAGPDPELKAEGIGAVTGAVTGCWYSPNLVAALFTFSGTVTMDGETVPFNLSRPISATSGAARWHFDESTDEDQATGTLETAPFLDFMRSVGVGVNDVEIRFVATRTG